MARARQRSRAHTLQAANPLRLAASGGSRPPCLVVLQGLEVGRRFDLDRPSVVLGRASGCEIEIDNEQVSRQHARVEVGTDGIVLADLGSRNGTFVNDVRVERCLLRDEDRIQVGPALFKFLGPDNIENAYSEALYRLSTTDPLTQLFNKRYFEETLEREASRAGRHGRPLALILFDLDHFKRINDTWGHLAGDAILAETSSRVRNLMRKEEVVARIGGEEFAVILPDTTEAQARSVAERIRLAVGGSRFAYEGREIVVTVSVGVSVRQTAADGVIEGRGLVQEADARLYEAKSAGRNCVRG